MRRLIAAGVVFVVTASAVLVALGAGGGGARGYRVDAIFDSADFLVAGQDVKIAGAVVGQVTGVHLTPDHRARIEMQVEDGIGRERNRIADTGLIGDCILRAAVAAYLVEGTVRHHVT